MVEGVEEKKAEVEVEAVVVVAEKGDEHQMAPVQRMQKEWV